MAAAQMGEYFGILLRVKWMRIFTQDDVMSFEPDSNIPDPTVLS